MLRLCFMPPSLAARALFALVQLQVQAGNHFPICHVNFPRNQSFIHFTVRVELKHCFKISIRMFCGDYRQGHPHEEGIRCNDNQMPTGCNRAQPDVEYVAGIGDEVGGYDLNQDN